MTCHQTSSSAAEEQSNSIIQISSTSKTTSFPTSVTTTCLLSTRAHEGACTGQSPNLIRVRSAARPCTTAFLSSWKVNLDLILLFLRQIIRWTSQSTGRSMNQPWQIRQTARSTKAAYETPTSPIVHTATSISQSKSQQLKFSKYPTAWWVKWKANHLHSQARPVQPRRRRRCKLGSKPQWTRKE